MKEELKPKEKEPPVYCANCGSLVPHSDLGTIARAIMRQKPACCYDCNKALGQVE